MDSQYKLLSELLSDQAAFITSPKTSLANYLGALPPCPPPPVSTGLTIFLSLSVNESLHLKVNLHLSFMEYQAGFSSNFQYDLQFQQTAYQSARISSNDFFFSLINSKMLFDNDKKKISFWNIE